MSGSVLASSTGWFPISHFSGFAFKDSDLIIGTQGHLEYGNVALGHDGAYISVIPETIHMSRIGTDGAGYGRLFLYNSPDGWAVGTSLIELAEYAQNRRWQLSIDNLQLKAMLLKPRLISMQLLSRETGFREIRLLMQHEELLIERGRKNTFKVVKRESHKEEDYATALTTGLRELIGRMRTLLDSRIPLVSDISGGRDSRTVLAALLAANDGAQPLGERVRFRSNTRLAADWAVASSLSEKYRLHVNRAPQAEQYSVDPIYGFHTWRKHDLGVYYPIYPQSTHSSEVALSGAAGGMHRSVYSLPELDENIRSLRSSRVTRREIERLTKRVQMTMRAVPFTTDPNLEHFRLFRNRFHGGRNALRGVSFAPLASESLKRASNLLSRQHLDRAQFYADVMINLASSLAAEPYDIPEKNWDERHYADLTEVVGDLSSAGGKVYGSIDHEAPPRATQIHPELDAFTKAFETNMRAVIDYKILPSVFVYEAGVELYRSEQDGFSHAVDGIPVSTVMFAGEAARLTHR